MPDFVVKTMFTGGGNLPKFFAKMTKGATTFGDKSSKAFNKASRSASKFQSLTKSILAAGAVQRGVGLLQQGVGAVTREFIGFDDSIVAASAKFKGLNLATKEGQAALNNLRKTARQVGADTQFSAGQAAQGFDFLAMAGFNMQQSIAALPGVVDLATVAQIDLARSTDIASDSLGAFGLMTKDAGQLQKNFTRLNDVMAKTMTSTNTDIEALFEAIKKGAPTFTSAGQSLESFNALLGVMANSGVKGEEAGTQLRNVMLRLANPTKKANIQLEKLGIRTQDASGNFRDVVDILADFEKGLVGMGNKQRAAALATVFGARAITGVNLLLQEGTGNLRKFRKELIAAGGSSKDMAGIIRQSLGNQLKALQSAAIELGFKFLTAFSKDGKGGIQALTQAIREFDPSPIINGLQQALTIAKVFYNILAPFLPLMPMLIGGWLAYTAVVKGAMAIGLIVKFVQFIKILKLATIAQWAFNVAANANPFGLIVTAIAAVVAGVVILYKNWDKITKAFVASFKAIIAGIKPLWNAFKSLFGFSGKKINLEVDIDTKKIPDKLDKIGKTPLTLINGGLTGKDTDDRELEPKIIPPNREEAEARQRIDFVGRLDIANAPEGSKVESKTSGAPPVDVNMLGVA